MTAAVSTIGAAGIGALLSVIIGCPATPTPASTPPTDTPANTAPTLDGATSPPPSVPTAAEQFLLAFQEHRFADALGLVDRGLADAPGDSVWLTYRGMCLAMLERYDDAVIAFLRAELATPSGFADQTGIYLRARALYQLKMYGRAQQELDRLHDQFPRSRLAERGQELAVAIERELGAGVSPTNLNWYLVQGLTAHSDAQPATAIEFLEEYLLLAQRLSPPSPAHPRAYLSLGGAYLELAATRRALTRLEAIPIAESDYRAGLFRALALAGEGDIDAAVQILEAVVDFTTSDAVRERAQRLLDRWGNPDPD